MLLVNSIGEPVSPMTKKKKCFPIRRKEQTTGHAKMFTTCYQIVKNYVEETARYRRNKMQYTYTSLITAYNRERRKFILKYRLIQCCYKGINNSQKIESKLISSTDIKLPKLLVCLTQEKIVHASTLIHTLIYSHLAQKQNYLTSQRSKAQLRSRTMQGF